MGLSVVPATTVKSEGFASLGKTGGAGNFLSIMSEELAVSGAGGASTREADSDCCPSRANAGVDVAQAAESVAASMAGAGDAQSLEREAASAQDDGTTGQIPGPLEGSESEMPTVEAGADDSAADAGEVEAPAKDALYAFSGALAAQLPQTIEMQATEGQTEAEGTKALSGPSTAALDANSENSALVYGETASTERANASAGENTAAPKVAPQPSTQSSKFPENSAATATPAAEPNAAPKIDEPQGGIFFDAETAAFAKAKGESAQQAATASSESAKGADAGTAEIALPSQTAQEQSDADAEADHKANAQAAEKAQPKRRAGHKASGGRAKLEETGWKLWGLAKGMLSEKAAAGAAANATANVAKPIPTSASKISEAIKPGEAKGLVRDEDGMPKVARKDEAPKAVKPDANAADRAFEATAKSATASEAKLPVGDAAEGDAKLALDAATVKTDAPAADAPAKDVAKPNQEVSRADREILRQVQGGVRINFLARGEKAVIQLMPEALGRVQVEITRTSQGLAANFKVETVEAKQALTTQVAELKNGFESRGVNLVSVQVELGSDGSSANGREAGQRRKGKPQFAQVEGVEVAANEGAAPEGWRPWGFETRA